MSVVVGISAEEEAEHHRVGMTQKWFHEALLVAKSEDQLLPDTDCREVSQLLAASQWGVTLMWQKGIISVETLRRQAVIKHCLDLMPFCRMKTRNWLSDLLGSLTTTTQGSVSTALPLKRVSQADRASTQIVKKVISRHTNVET